MLILAVGDTHYNIRKNWLTWVAAEAPRYDAVCLPGDFLDQFQASDDDLRRQIDDVLTWFAHFPAGPQLFLASGNHDEIEPETDDAEHWLQRARRPGVAVDGDILAFGGLTFACAGWNAVVPQLGAGPVVLVTHAPPAETVTAIATEEHNEDFGDFETRQVGSDDCRQGACCGPSRGRGGAAPPLPTSQVTQLRMAGCRNLSPKTLARD